MDNSDIRKRLMQSTGQEVRLAVRNGLWSAPTRGLAKGYVQAGLVAIPRNLVNDFLMFCQKNPGPCPLIEVTENGITSISAVEGNIATDMPAYNLYINGELAEQSREIGQRYMGQLTWFLMGCSYSFEYLLQEAGMTLKGMEQGQGNPIFITNIPCVPSGLFSGNLVVSMRPIPMNSIGNVSYLSGKLPIAHGAPVHVGDPSIIGIKDINKPDYGTPLTISSDELPVFWACSITPQAIAKARKIPLMITQKPGHMFVTDIKTINCIK